MGIATDFINLGEGMLAAFDDRINFLGHNIVEVKRMADDTHKFLNQTRKDHKAMARGLRADLGAFVGDLTDNVDKLRQGFRKEQRAVHQECKANHQAFQKVAKTMAGKRNHFDASVKNAAQKFTQKTTKKH